MTDLTLFEIETGLAELIAHRAQRLLDTEDPPTEEEVAAIDGEIDRYQFAEPVKVSGVAAMFRSWKFQRGAALEEIKRLRAIVDVLDLMDERLKLRVGAALEVLPAPKKGCRTLTGRDGSRLILKGNGGVEPLQVDGWDADRKRWLHDTTVLPDEYQKVTVSMSLNDWKRVWDFACDEFREEMPRVLVPVFAEPDATLIRETLGKPCSACQGLPDSDPVGNPVLCPICGGSGKQPVPGARLLPRGSHVEVK